MFDLTSWNNFEMKFVKKSWYKFRQCKKSSTLLQLVKMKGCGMKVTSNQNNLQQKHFWKHKIKKITKMN